MSRAGRIWIAVGCAYLAIAVFTFGYAGAHHRCDARDRELELCGFDSVFAGLGGAFLWPLYWSWELQS